MNKPLTLLQEAALTEDIALNGEGIDPAGLRQAVLLTEEDYTEPYMSGEELLLLMAQERKARRGKA